jgi:hypothetical protein
MMAANIRAKSSKTDREYQEFCAGKSEGERIGKACVAYYE